MEQNLKRDDLLLYGVTDRYWLNGRNLRDDVLKAIKGGATMIQLREKNLSDEEFLKEAIEIKKVCHDNNVLLIINDNLDVMLKSDADGIHVGQDDLDASYVRKCIGNKILGVSARNVKEAKKALADGADYLGVGAMFRTSTKDDALIVSMDELDKICELTENVVIIGGINISNIKDFKDSNIAGISVVSAIFGQDNIKLQTNKLLKEVKKWLR